MFKMRGLWKEVSPSGAVSDLRHVFAEAGQRRWLFLGLAMLGTATMFAGITQEKWRKQRQLPEVTYIRSWPEHRTDAETRAFIVANQRRKEAEQARIDQALAEEREIYAKLGRATGVNVDQAIKRGDQERAAARASEAAAAEAILRSNGER